MNPVVCFVVTFLVGHAASQTATTSFSVVYLQRDAAALLPLARTALVREFLQAAEDLPAAPVRTLYRDESKTRYLNETDYQALPPERRAEFTPVKLNESFYYNTRYGSPLAYSRALDVLAEAGFASLDGKRVMDFGYGGIGHLRLMALCGAQVVGVEVDPMLKALYSGAGDTGEVRSKTRAGRITLVHGQWPAGPGVRESAGSGFDLIVSKNTLKNGYIHPAEPVDPKKLVHLGVDDEKFVRAVADSLRPGGLFLIYNICPAPAAAGQSYIPWADGRCPFSRELFEKFGLRVLKIDEQDDAACRAMARALGWGEGSGAMNLESDLFAWYTLVRKPGE